jgi:hypothetical protein
MTEFKLFYRAVYFPFLFLRHFLLLCSGEQAKQGNGIGSLIGSSDGVIYKFSSFPPKYPTQAHCRIQLFMYAGAGGLFHSLVWQIENLARSGSLSIENER